jgi:histidyl-tRNA synthetase
VRDCGRPESRYGLWATRVGSTLNPSFANSLQAEFLYKVKPKLPAQFKAAEANGTPFALILAEAEIAAGVVKMKEMGLPDGHPEKEGVDVRLDNLEAEVIQRLARKKALDELTKQADGLKVVHGIKGEEVKAETVATEQAAQALEEAPAPSAAS